MKTIAILGGGTAGTTMANKLRSRLGHRDWRIVVIDRDDHHFYQPGYIFVPFGINRASDLVKSRKRFLPRDVELIITETERIEPKENRLRFSDGRTLDYDYLIIATGTAPVPEETPGLKGEGWRRNVFDFYTLDGAEALGRFLHDWRGGRLVMNIVEMPIKCPVAPLEVVFLADWWFKKRGLRDRVDISYVTPLPAAFTKPRAAEVFGDFLRKKGITVVPEFNTGSVDESKQVLKSFDGREVPYDLLITVPLNKGSEVIERSAMGDELNYVPTDKHTLKSKQYDNVFVLGDATDLPTSKAGSVAHFQADVLTANLLRVIKGEPPAPEFDGHANCFIETGHKKAMLIDFNYDVEPLPGRFPLPGVGPMPLLKESVVNHMGKLAFRWIYWNILLPGRWLPVPTRMSRAGKEGL